MMDRVTSHRFVPAIERALQIVPAPLHPLVTCDFLTGTDPIFAGLHSYVDGTDGRSYRTTAHAVYPYHQRYPLMSNPTVVLQRPTSPEVVVHELGHILHWRLRFSWWPRSNVSWYAARNKQECFAEAFTSWLIPSHADRPDEATVDYFDRLLVSSL